MSANPNANDVVVVAYNDTAHQQQVVTLWRDVFGYTEPRNDARMSLLKKLALDDGLLFVAVDAQARVVGTTMAGYDGHRGWLYSVAVVPALRGRGVGERLVQHAEEALARLGCVKINLQVVASNAATVAFYERLGYAQEPRISMGKEIARNVTS